MAQQLHAIIPAGGAGTRLWPLSRADHPKFLLDLLGNGRSLLQATVSRLAPITASATVVTGHAHAQLAGQQLGDQAEIVVEPSARNSMPAIGLAAAILHDRHGNCLVGSFAADHVVRDEEALLDAVRTAIAAANAGYVCTIGISPTYGATGFGYIHTGAPLPGVDGASKVASFVEKPDATTAQKWFEQGGYLWNAGMFVTQTQVLFEALGRFDADFMQRLEDLGKAWDTPRRDSALAQWDELTKIAIDHAVAEPEAARGNVATVATSADLGWTDLGDFGALAQLLPPEQLATNAVVAQSPRALVLDTAGTGPIAVLGIEDAVVVRCGDALLVTTRQYAQQVGNVAGQVSSLYPQVR